ncbi:hypothetical protein BDR06DRAFT_1005605 [Suillus hirtellus]|nr:hypothetical protein BDR06DRAFT_1005605 [Suillus hirtellus]
MFAVIISQLYIIFYFYSITRSSSSCVHKSYNVDFGLVPIIGGNHALEAPDGTKLEHFLSWVQRLPDREPPAWLSLPPTAERVIALAQGNELLNKLRKMQTLVDDDELGSAANSSKSQTFTSDAVSGLRNCLRNPMTILILFIVCSSGKLRSDANFSTKFATLVTRYECGRADRRLPIVIQQQMST